MRVAGVHVELHKFFSKALQQLSGARAVKRFLKQSLKMPTMSVMWKPADAVYSLLELSPAALALRLVSKSIALRITARMKLDDQRLHCCLHALP